MTVDSPPKRSTFGSLFSRTLPPYRGPCLVGVRDVELPVSPRTFGTFKHRSIPNGQVGITLDTVKFTLFYPTVPTTAHEAPAWFPRLIQTVDGLLKVANWSSNPFYRIVFYVVAALITWGTTFPGFKNAPLKAPSRSTKWRVVLYSHGAGCSWLMNSAVCGELASRGYVVAAIEHHDGTSPSVRMTNDRGETRDLYWLNWLDLEWTESQPTDDNLLRHVQLDVRLAELEVVFEALQRLMQGQELVSTALTPSLSGWEGWHAIEATKPIIAGHSFGGILAMLAAANPRFNFSHVVVFDPATRRLHKWDKTISMPLLAINSEEYADGEQFSKLLSIAQCAEAHEIYVVRGAMHPSFSDVFLILPDHVNRWIGLAVDPLHILDQTVGATIRFLKGEEINVYHTVECVDGVFLNKGIQIGNLVRCRISNALMNDSPLP